MSDDQTEVIEHAVRAGRDPRWRLFVQGALVLFAVAVLVMVGLYLRLNSTTSFLHGQVDALTSQQAAAARDAQQLAAQVRGLGATPVVSPPAAVPGPAGPQGPGPSQAEIDDAVNGYFAQHPPGATPAMIAVQVASYLTTNPPAPGRPPTQAEIATATSDYLSSHVAQFQGQPGATGAAGPTGAPGQDATDAQVQSAVAAYCSTHNGCAGPAGADGPAGAQGAQGISVTDLAFQRDSSGACQVVITLHDPATNTDTTITHPAGAAACPLLGGG